MKLAGLLSVAGKDLGLRFNLVGLLPSTLLALYILAIVWSRDGSTTDLSRIPERASALNAGELVLLSAGLLAVALLLAPLQLGLVRALEGYWGESRAGRALAALAASRHRRRFARLTSIRDDEEAPEHGEPAARVDARRRAAAVELERSFPRSAERILPTRLGNTLRAAEDRAGRTYGLDAVALWPRLYLVLPPATARVLDDQRTQLDLAARMCATAVAAALIWAVALGSGGDLPAVPFACGAVAWLAYRGAIAASLLYGELLKVAFDLHRFDLLRALHLPLPADYEEERRANKRLSDFLRQGFTENYGYDHAGGEARPLTPQVEKDG